MRLEGEYNYKILLRMTSENVEETFQLVKDDITKENTKMTFYEHYYSFYSTMNSSTFTSFCAFVFSIFSSLIKKPNHLI